jgi:zinc protease
MIIDRKLAPAVNEIQSFRIVKPVQTRLPNGIPLHIINSGLGDLIKVEWMMAAGNWFQPSPLVAFTVNNTLIEGTNGFSSKQIAENIEFYGAIVGYNVDKDNAYLSAVTLRKHLPYIMEIMADILKNAIFPEREIEIFLQKHRQLFQIEQGKVSQVARHIHARTMFGNSHPYGYQITESDFSNIDTVVLRSFYAQHYCPENCQMIVSGKVEDADVRLLEQHFGQGSWGNYIEGQRINPQIATETLNKVFFAKNNAVQNAIRIGKIVGNKLNPDYAGLSVLNCVLGGYFGSRLMKKVREEKGYTYGINSMLVTLVNSGYFTIVTEVGSAVTQSALDDIYAEMDLLRTEKVPEDELSRVKNYMLGEMVRMFDGPFAQAESLISLLEYNLEYSYYDKLIHEIHTISSDKLIALANKYFDPQTMNQIVVGQPF